MSKEQGLFQHPFFKGRKITEIYQYNSQQNISRAVGLIFFFFFWSNRLNNLALIAFFGWRRMAAINLEMDKNDQFKMMSTASISLLTFLMQH